MFSKTTNRTKNTVYADWKKTLVRMRLPRCHVEMRILCNHILPKKNEFTERIWTQLRVFVIFWSPNTLGKFIILLKYGNKSCLNQNIFIVCSFYQRFMVTVAFFDAIKTFSAWKCYINYITYLVQYSELLQVSSHI